MHVLTYPSVPGFLPCPLGFPVAVSYCGHCKLADIHVGVVRSGLSSAGNVKVTEPGIVGLVLFCTSAARAATSAPQGLSPATKRSTLSLTNSKALTVQLSNLLLIQTSSI